jgi:hypothetical protein
VTPFKAVPEQSAGGISLCAAASKMVTATIFWTEKPLGITESEKMVTVTILRFLGIPKRKDALPPAIFRCPRSIDSDKIRVSYGRSDEHGL